jgi:signal transduction histidine kinase
VLLAVHDDGCGIAPEHLEVVFQPFFTTKPPGQGTGLGLSVVYGIVRGWGGTIHAASAPGRGTTMTVAIPIAGGRDAARQGERLDHAHDRQEHPAPAGG